MAVLAAFLAVLNPPRAQAVDMQPDDFISLPAGTHVFLDYASYSRSTKLDAGGVKKGANLDAYGNLFRYAYFFNLGPFITDINLLLPVAHIPDLEIGGNEIDGETGIGDPQIVSTVWLVSEPESRRYLGVVGYLSIPLGEYDRHEAINPGSNRWTGTLQMGYWQGLTSKLAIQLSADVTWYGDNDEYGFATLTQDETYAAGGWLRYDFNPKTYAAVGYQVSTGGDQSVAGVDLNVANKYQRVRFAAARFITSDVQLYGELGFDVVREDGFRQDVGALIRLLKVF